MKPKPLVFAVLGAGRIGRMHALNLLSMPTVQLKIVLDKYLQTDWLPPNATVTVTKDLTQILDDREIDAIVIATSSNSHVELIRAILPTGKHIFAEKPVSFSSAVLAELEQEVAAAGIKLQLGYNRRYDPNIMKLKQKLVEHDLSKLYLVNIKNRDPVRPPLAFIPKSGGMLFDFNVHDFDMIHFLTNTDISSIYVLGANLIDPKLGELGDIDVALISMKLANGAFAVIDTARETGYGYDQEIEVFAECGSFKLQNVRTDTLLCSTPEHITIAPPKANFSERYREAYFIQFEKFITWLNAPQQHPGEISLSDGRRAICVAEAAARSLETGLAQPICYKSA